jgi:hypothetical protein
MIGGHSLAKQGDVLSCLAAILPRFLLLHSRCGTLCEQTLNVIPSLLSKRNRAAASAYSWAEGLSMEDTTGRLRR